MSEVERSGRTVLFVSHNMDAIVRLCPTAMWLDQGPGARRRADRRGDRRVHARVRSLFLRAVDGDRSKHSGAGGGCSIVDEEGVPQATLTTRSSSWIQVDVVANEPPPTLDVSCQVATRGGIGILDEALSDVEVGAMSKPGRYRIRCHLPPILTPGEYTISVCLGSWYELLDQHENIVAFTVDGDDLGRLRRLVRLSAEWQAIRLDDHLHDE